jgi:Ca2+/H+ antiporter
LLIVVALNYTELLVNVVDVVLNGSGIDEKFLGVTLFALVPNTTEFMNAVSFAMNGNIALRYVLTCPAPASKKIRGY